VKMKGNIQSILREGVSMTDKGGRRGIAKSPRGPSSILSLSLVIIVIIFSNWKSRDS
jgi:hypothetical protein